MTDIMRHDTPTGCLPNADEFCITDRAAFEELLAHVAHAHENYLRCDESAFPGLYRQLELAWHAGEEALWNWVQDFAVRKISQTLIAYANGAEQDAASREAMRDTEAEYEENEEWLRKAAQRALPPLPEHQGTMH